MADATTGAVTLPPPSPALTMHQAAAELREAAGAMLAEMQARPEEWASAWAAEMDGALGGPSGVLAGKFSPAAALALADWLDETAARLVKSTHPGWQATVAPAPFALARAVLAGPTS